MLHPYISREGALNDVKVLRPNCYSVLSTWSHGLYLRTSILNFCMLPCMKKVDWALSPLYLKCTLQHIKITIYLAVPCRKYVKLELNKHMLVSKDGPYAMHYRLANQECTGKCCCIDPDLLQLVNITLASSPLTVTLWWDEWHIYYSAIRGGNRKYNCYNPDIRYMSLHTR